MRFLILNGPNLNLLGQRETQMYGTQTLMELEAGLRRFAQSLGVEIECQQSNQEGHLIDALHRARHRFQGVVFNPGGYAHTSVALRDAIAAIPIPVVEVHLTNIYAREEFRHRSITGGACAGVITGLGATGYELALTALLRLARPAGESVRPPQAAELPRAVQPERPSLPSPEEAREPREEREGKRRRRGRRGGRGRRRGEERLPEAAREEPVASGEEARETEPLSARYAHLKGAVVRRGLDVLAEEVETPPPPPLPGRVTFVDLPPEPPAAAGHTAEAERWSISPRPEPERDAAEPAAAAAQDQAPAEAPPEEPRKPARRGTRRSTSSGTTGRRRTRRTQSADSDESTESGSGREEEA